MNLDVILTAATRGTEAFVQMSGALMGIKAEAESTGASLDNLKVHTDAASSAQTVLGKSTVDVQTVMKDTRARVDEMKAALVSHGASTKDADAAFKSLTASMAKKAVFTEMSAALRDAGQWSKDLAPGLRLVANEMVNAEQAAQDSQPVLSGLQNAWTAVSGAITPLGGYVMPALIASLVAAGIALSPMIVALGAWLIVTSALTVGLLGFIGVVGLAALAVGGLGAAIIALGVAQQGGLDPAGNLTKAQTGMTSAVKAHENALWSLSQAQAAAQGTAATPAQLHAVEQAQWGLSQAQAAAAGTAATPAQLHAVTQAQWGLQQAQAAVTAGQAGTPAQLHAISQAQWSLSQAQAAAQGTAATPAQLNAVSQAQWSLSQAQAAAAGTAATPAQLHAVSQAQDQVNQTTEALATAQTALATAQKNADTPLAHLIEGFHKVKDVLGEGAVPLTNQMATEAQKLLGPIQDLGERLERWFGGNLPGLLESAARSFKTISWAVDQLGDAFKPLFEYLASHESTFQFFFNLFTVLGVSAIAGLVQNLVKLSDWFTSNWAALAPIAGAGFDLLGRAIQGIGPVTEKVINWIVDHWPEIVRMADLSAQAFGLVVEASWLVLSSLQALGPLFKFLEDHGKETKAVLGALMAIVLVAVGVFVLLVAIVVVVVAAIVGLIAVIETSIKWLGENLPAALRWAGDRFSDLGRTARDVTSWIGQGFSDLGSAVHKAVTWMGDRFSDLGRMANGLKDSIGGVFSGLGSAIHGGLKDVLATIGRFDDAVDSIPIIGGILNLPKSSQLPQFAQGGIVNRPTLGVFGEAGPEALIPVGAGAGPRAVELWQKAGQMLGMGAGGGFSMNPGDVGGQCVVFVQNLTGHHFDVAMASQMAAFVNSQTAAPGEIFVSTTPPYGHTGMVIGNGKVLDSNWGLDERIQIHNLSDIGGIAGYISGLPAAGLPGGVLDVSGALAPLVTRVTSGLGGWPGKLATGLLNSLVTGLGKKYDTGGPLMPGATLAVNNTGRPESVLGSRAEELLASIDRRLATTSEGPDRVDNTNELLVQLYNLLAERLPSGSGTAFSTRAYNPAT